MKVGLIRCMQTEEACPATTDFAFMRKKAGAFSGVEGEIELVGVNSCGGCPGKKAVFRAREMVRRGADTIALASCIQKGTPIGYPCPFFEIMRDSIKKNLGEEIHILEYTH